MASAGSPLGAFINVRKGQEHDPRGLTLGDLMEMTPHEALMAGLDIAGEDLAALDAGQPALRPAREVSDPWGAKITADEQAQREGAVRAMQNIPYSPLAAGVELAAPSAYDALTREVPGANPEAPNVVAALDNLSLGGLIEAPVARSLLRTRPPSARETAPARLRGMPRGGEETAPPFYSQARTVVEDPKTQGTQTGEAWLKFMQDPKRGVKAEELEFTRLGDFLKERRGERVTRDEILGHLDSNEIEVKEVTKGSPLQSELGAAEDAFKAIAHRALSASDQQIQDLALDVARGDVGMESLNDSMRPAAQELRRTYLARQHGTPFKPTKFERYTLPGAENYREVLLTLPATKPAGQTKWTTLEGPSGWSVFADGRQVGHWYKSEAPTAADAIREAQVGWSSGELPESQRGGFTSSHWDEPNVLAHLRLSDRDMDGKRTLLVEEIQSDWAQKGRKEGFRPDDADWLDKRRQQIEALGERATQEQKREWAAIKNELEKNIPTAPFVRDTTRWTTLGLKRILKMAADEGYDRVAIVPGAEQAKRYDLSKQVDRVEWIPGDKTLRAYRQGADTSPVISRTLNSESELADVIGKEAAEKLLRQPLDESKINRAPFQKLEGEELSIGGEGMKGYYDKIVPDALNKLAKEYGVKVQLEGGKVRPKGTEGADFYISSDEAGGFAIYDSADEMGAPIAEGFKTEEDARKYMRTLDLDAVPVHTLEVPPEMREKIKKKGFPLYSSLTLGDMMGAQNA
jgi:hypothetical protein